MQQINHEILEQELLEVLELIRKNKELDNRLEARGLLKKEKEGKNGTTNSKKV